MAVRKQQRRSHMLGLGLDNKDGHVRLTKGHNFSLFGGSEETHEHMQETAVKINEKLKQRSKALEEVTPQEFADIAEEVGLKPIPKPK